MSTKFTPETRATILEALKENPSLPSAATKAGIHTTTLRAWIDKGEQGAPEFAEFALECAEARQTMKDEIVAALFKTATDELHPQQTKAAHQLLTNLYPTEFSNVRHVVQHQNKTEDELRQLRKTRLKLRAEEPMKPAVMLVDAIEVPGGKS
jgi:transposase-like protein